MGALSNKALETVQLAQLNVARLITLINDLLDIEKMKAGKIRISKRQIVLEELFERACDTLQVLANQKSIDLEFQNTEAIANADYDRIMQVLINLLGNAIKFSPDNSTVTISAKRSETSVTAFSSRRKTR